MGAIAWMQRGPFGVMVHWTKHSMPRAGRPDPDWNRVVDRFPVASFCDALVGMGAKWLIFPFTHVASHGLHACAPNAHYETVLPGVCARRDLFGELARALRARDIRLLAYFPADADSDALTDDVRAALGWERYPDDRRVYQAHITAMVREWALRYGDLLDGWWIDGCFDARTKSWARTHTWHNGRFDMATWVPALRAGNPRAVFAMNPGVCSGRHAACFPAQDYLAGEANDLAIRPTAPLQDGLQWCSLVWIDCFWGHWDAPGPIAPPRFTTDDLHAYVADCHTHGGAVTLNLGIYEDGTLPEESVAQVTEIGRRMGVRV